MVPALHCTALHCTALTSTAHGCLACVLHNVSQAAWPRPTAPPAPRPLLSPACTGAARGAHRSQHAGVCGRLRAQEEASARHLPAGGTGEGAGMGIVKAACLDYKLWCNSRRWCCGWCCCHSSLMLLLLSSQLLSSQLLMYLPPLSACRCPTLPAAACRSWMWSRGAAWWWRTAASGWQQPRRRACGALAPVPAPAPAVHCPSPSRPACCWWGLLCWGLIGCLPAYSLILIASPSSVLPHPVALPPPPPFFSSPAPLLPAGVW